MLKFSTVQQLFSWLFNFTIYSGNTFVDTPGKGDLLTDFNSFKYMFSACSEGFLYIAEKLDL